MSIRTPEPRLPLEPEEYPIYRPPSRVGCSALTIITLVTVLTFALLLWRVTPHWAEAIVDVPRGLLSGDSGDGGVVAEGTPGAATYATQTAELPTPTIVPVVVNPTPVRECVQVANTGGSGVRLRVEPQQNARSVVTVGEGATFWIVGPDVQNAVGTWRNVQLLPPDGRGGFVLTKYLITAPCP